MLPLVDKEVPVRRRLLGRIHKQAKDLWGQDYESNYRAFLYAMVQKNSCVDMTTDELRTVEQALYERVVRNSSHPKTDMTTAQITMIIHLCKQLGWDGPADIRFKNFVNRTLKVQLMNFEAMTQKQASHVITGLQKWLEGMKA